MLGPGQAPWYDALLMFNPSRLHAQHLAFGLRQSQALRKLRAVTWLEA